MFPNRKLTFIFAAFLAASMLQESKAQSSQSLTLGVSRVYSTFSFVDSTGTKDKTYSKIGAAGYSVGYNSVMESGLFIHGRIGVHNSSISMDYEGLNVLWNLQYLDLSISPGYIYTKSRLQPYLSVGPCFSSLLKGEQSMAGKTYDMASLNSIGKTDFSLIINPGVKFVLSDYMSVFGEYQANVGLMNIEKTSGQKTFNRGFAINLGLHFSIESFKKEKPATHAEAAPVAEPAKYQRTDEVDESLRHLRGIINK